MNSQSCGGFIIQIIKIKRRTNSCTETYITCITHRKVIFDIHINEFSVGIRKFNFKKMLTAFFYFSFENSREYLHFLLQTSLLVVGAITWMKSGFGVVGQRLYDGLKRAAVNRYIFVIFSILTKQKKINGIHFISLMQVEHEVVCVVRIMRHAQQHLGTLNHLLKIQ